MRRSATSSIRFVVGTCLLATLPAAGAQQAATTRPADKPPIAHGWIDIATYASPGMPGMAAMMMGGGGKSPLSGLMGGGAGNAKGNQFGLTQSGGGNGSYVDVTVRTSRNPNLAEAVQAVPEGTKLAPTLQLEVLPQAKPAEGRDDADYHPPGEPPKGKIKLYWGCGATIRPDQPKVVDLSTSSIAQFGEIFQGRSATQRGAHSAAGRPVWPNPQDDRRVPDGASFAGAHAFTGQGIPESFSFTLPPAQDIMPAIALRQAVVDGVTQLSWDALPTARAYFIAAMGGRGESSGSTEMTLWTSSELPDSGVGLIEYQTNKAVDQWLREKVLLPPATTRCDVPKGIFGEGESSSGAMLRMIAYGSELNLAHPPRPTDPKVAWEPDWALKVRVKSVAMAMLGMPSMDGMDMGGVEESPAGTDEAAPAGAEQPKKKKKFSLKDAMDAVKDNVPLPN